MNERRRMLSVITGMIMAVFITPLGFSQAFQIEEATIDGIHDAIKKGQTTCTDLVKAYIDRAKAYNGVCTELVTADGASIPPVLGYVRAGSPLVFPTATVPVSSVLPNFDQYVGLPIDFGRMEMTVSDPSVSQQFGMVVGISNARQLNALSTLNIRGERSVTCKGAYDAPPSSGPVPAGAPPACEAFRQQLDALEQAAQLDKQYGKNPDLKKLPMYCIPFSFKDVFDTKDMRSTGGGDVNYAMDAAPEDSTIAAELRAKGAVIYAKANLSEYNGGGRPTETPNPVIPLSSIARPQKNFPVPTMGRSTWAGQTCNPYDTERSAGASSSGSAVSVSANLVVCSVCESTGGSCQYPASRNGVVNFVTTKGLISYGGGIGQDPYVDRAGIQCRTVKDAALVLDALKDPQRGYFDPRDIYTALPKVLVSKEPYANFVVDTKHSKSKPLAGIRIGIEREYMVKAVKNQEAISDQVNDEIKRVLRDQLGAELVESVDPLYPDDPTIPNMKFTFQNALAQILPFHMPEFFFQTTSNGALEYAVPGYDVRTRDYMAKLAAGLAPLPANLNMRRILAFGEAATQGCCAFSFHLAQYLFERRDERVNNWASLNANAKYFTDVKRAAYKNLENQVDIRSEGFTEGMKLRDVMRLVVLKVMHENKLDVLVHPTFTSQPPPKIGFAGELFVPNATLLLNPGPLLGFPDISVPAGFNQVAYEPKLVLASDKKDYTTVAGTERSLLPHPMPFSITFLAGPGDEPILLKVASAYEAATHHRRQPPDFGPLRATERTGLRKSVLRNGK